MCRRDRSTGDRRTEDHAGRTGLARETVEWPDVVGPSADRPAVVLDVLLVALQPVLALLRRPQRRYVLHLRLDENGELDVTVEASSLARAAARAIDDAEQAGAVVVAIEVVDGRFDPSARVSAQSRLGPLRRASQRRTPIQEVRR